MVQNLILFSKIHGIGYAIPNFLVCVILIVFFVAFNYIFPLSWMGYVGVN